MTTPAAGASRHAERMSRRTVQAILAAVMLSVGLSASGGRQTDIAMLVLLVAIAGVALSIWGEDGATSRGWQLMQLCVVLQGVQLAVDAAATDAGPAARLVLAATLAFASGAACMSVRAEGVPAWRWLLLAVALVVAWGISMLALRRVPGIDSLMFQREAAAGLLHLENPYARTFRDPYPPEASRVFYGPGTSVDGVLRTGFMYMPFSLLLSLAGHMLGDVRYASLLCMAGAALLIAHAAPQSRGARAAALLLLTTPVMPMVLYLGWNDTHVVLLLAACHWCRERRPALLPYALGLLMVTKQYTIVMLPAALLFLPWPATAQTLLAAGWRALATGLAVTLPFVLWDIPAFVHSAIRFHFTQPFRPDALSFVAWAQAAHPERLGALPFALAALAWVALMRRARTVTVPATQALAMVLLAFFCSSKQAFVNYFYVVIGCLCMAAAALQRPTVPAPPRDG